MLWSLLKILIFVALVAAMTYGAGYLMETGPGVRIAVGSIELNLGPLQAVIGALLLFVAIWVVLRLAGFLVALIKFLNGDDTAISRYFSRNRERRGYEALSDSVLALASGEGQLAITKANKAGRYLDNPALTTLITAQAAEMVGDRKKAEATYKQLLSNEKTRFAGIQGLLKHKIEDGDSETALKLAEKAFALKPKHGLMQDTLLKLQAENEDWSGARKTLGAKLKHGTLPRDVHRRRDAVLALSEAREVLDEGNTVEAREAAIEANRLSPDLVPATVMAARAYIEQGKPRYATRILRKTWETQPHPELAVAFAEIAPDETPAARLKRFDTLIKAKPDHPEAIMLKAELEIANEDFPAARRTLGDLATEHPTARSVAIMAAIERGAGADDATVRGWLARAVTAPRGPQWVCDNCHNIESKWAPVCSNCASFDTLSWTEPPEAELAMPTGSAMLPLIVGPSAPVETPEAEVEPETVEVPEETVAEEVLAPEEDEVVTQPRTDFVVEDAEESEDAKAKS